MTTGNFGILDAPTPLFPNQLYYGDNYTIMREQMRTASVDLIYLDPPFNSQRNYNLIYKKLTGQPVPEQEEAFCDAWDLDAEKLKMVREMDAVLRRNEIPDDVLMFFRAWTSALQNTRPRLLAYLIYMTYRLAEMKRILKPTGSIYLHCDPTASHYIKMVMDGIFGHNNFRSELIWKRSHAHNSARRWGPIHDVVLYYTNSERYTWNRVYQPYEKEYIDRYFKFDDGDGRGLYWTGDLTGTGTRQGPSGEAWRGFDVRGGGRHWAYSPEEVDRLDAERRIYWPPTKGAMPKLKRYLSEAPGIPAQDLLLDVPSLQRMSSAYKETLGYPTQKPIGLLTRIIEASSKPGDVVFDPFAGCGASIYAAHLTGRRWIGCDIGILSVEIVKEVLLKRYGLKEGVNYNVAGIPRSEAAAKVLFETDPRQFQHWAVEQAGGFASTKHSGDRGIDGRIHFETRDGLRNMVLSVKGGKLHPAFTRELIGTFQREADTEMGGMICLQSPTRGMLADVANAGMFTYLGKDYPRLQIRTVQDLLDGRGFDTPSKVEKLGWQNGAVPLPI